MPLMLIVCCPSNNMLMVHAAEVSILVRTAKRHVLEQRVIGAVVREFMMRRSAYVSRVLHQCEGGAANEQYSDLIMTLTSK
jgi:hypothetical protein